MATKTKEFNLVEFSEKINGLSVEELRSLNALVVRTIKFKNQVMAMSAMDQFKVGDKVKFNKLANLGTAHSHLEKAVFNILKLNKTKIKIQEVVSHLVVNAPAEWIEKV